MAHGYIFIEKIQKNQSTCTFSIDNIHQRFTMYTTVPPYSCLSLVASAYV